MGKKFEVIVMRLVPHNFDEQATKWQEVISEKLFRRPIYLVEEQEIQYSRIAKQFLGIYGNEYEMKEYLYTLTNGNIEWTLLFNHLPKEIRSEDRTAIVDILQLNRENPISLNRFMAFFAGKQLLPLMNTKYRNHFVDTLRRMLVLLENRYPKFKSHNVQRVFLDFVKWSNHYFPKWLEENDFENAIPKIFWYGPLKESEAFFVYFLYLFGFDVVIFKPDATDDFVNYGINDFPTERLENKTEVFEFPFEKPMQIQTMTAQAENVVQEHLYSNAALNYSWKYAEYETRTRILSTTYDELFILSKAQLYLREGFTDEPGIVYLPVLFAKIEGVSENMKDYAQKLNTLIESELTHVATEFPLLPVQKSNMQFHMRDASENGKLSVEKIMNLSIWPYKNMPLGAQRNIARTMIRLIKGNYIQPLVSQRREDHEQYLFGQVLLIPKEIMRLYQQFDYSFNNPKIIIFKEKQSPPLERQDAIMLMFLSLLGFDLFIFNPEGSMDLETYIQAGIMNKYRLEKISFEENLNEILSVNNRRSDFKAKEGIFSVIKKIAKKRL